MLARVSRSLPHLASSIAFTALHVKRWPPSLASAASAVVAGDPVGVGCLAHSSFSFSVLGEFEFSSSQVSFSCFFRRWRTTEKQEPKLAHSICRFFNCAKKRFIHKGLQKPGRQCHGPFDHDSEKASEGMDLVHAAPTPPVEDALLRWRSTTKANDKEGKGPKNLQAK